ncbi:MAG: DUF502 domain-containing protein [Candidatus Methanosuratincola sp.]|jgi:uncharacterized membrane protein
MSRIAGSIKRNFLAGIIIIAPFGITLLLLYNLGRWVASLVSKAPATFLGPLFADLPPPLFETAAVLVGLLSAFLAVLVVGAVARNFLGRKLIGLGEGMIARIPLARTIYSATKQIAETVFLNSGMKGLKRVVLVEFPRKGCYSLAFVTGVVSLGEQSGGRMLSLFLPTSPNPTSGFYVVIPEEDVTELDMSTEEAFKIIMSLGLAKDQSGSFVFGGKHRRSP